MDVTNLLLTGPPRVGKTTLIQRLLEQHPVVRASGFYTVELREGGHRVGFEAITLQGQRHVLSHVAIRSRWRVGRYGVDVPGFEQAIVPHIDPLRLAGVQLLVVDEIGKMECFSALFREVIVKALDAPLPLVGTIALRGSPFIEGLKERPDVRLLRVTPQNRVRLLQELQNWLQRVV